MKYDELEHERQRLLYVELPCLLHRILRISKLPLPTNKEIVNVNVKQIKKITNAECKSALENFKSGNHLFKKRKCIKEYMTNELVDNHKLDIDIINHEVENILNYKCKKEELSDDCIDDNSTF